MNRFGNLGRLLLGSIAIYLFFLATDISLVWGFDEDMFYEYAVFSTIYIHEAEKTGKMDLPDYLSQMKDRFPELSGRPDDLAAAIEREGRKRDSFVERHLAVTPRDPRFYHLLLNNDKFTVKEMADSVLCLLSSRRMLAS